METAVEMIEQEWAASRWRGIERTYTAQDVGKIRGSVRVEYSLARQGAEKLWRPLHDPRHIAALGAST